MSGQSKPAWLAESFQHQQQKLSAIRAERLHLVGRIADRDQVITAKTAQLDMSLEYIAMLESKVAALEAQLQTNTESCVPFPSSIPILDQRKVANPHTGDIVRAKHAFVRCYAFNNSLSALDGSPALLSLLPGLKAESRRAFCSQWALRDSAVQAPDRGDATRAPSLAGRGDEAFTREHRRAAASERALTRTRATRP